MNDERDEKKFRKKNVSKENLRFSTKCKIKCCNNLENSIRLILAIKTSPNERREGWEKILKGKCLEENFPRNVELNVAIINFEEFDSINFSN